MHVRAGVSASAARCWIDWQAGPHAAARPTPRGCDGPCRGPGAAPSAPRRLAQSLDGLLAIPGALPAAARAAAAARAFAEGNGLLPGLRVNRRA